jgi:hypothetical protein
MLVWQTPRNEEMGMNWTVRRVEEVTRNEHVATGVAQKIMGKSLALMQVNCRSIFNKSLDFFEFDAYNPDAIIGTEPWLREDICNAEVFRDDYTAFKRERNTRGSGVFICVTKYIACVELWAVKDFEMIAAEVEGRNAKFTWEIIGTYRAPNEDMQVIERLAT